MTSGGVEVSMARSGGKGAAMAVRTRRARRSSERAAREQQKVRRQSLANIEIVESSERVCWVFGYTESSHACHGSWRAVPEDV